MGSRRNEVCGRVCLLSCRCKNVCSAVAETLGGLELKWFNDQIALNHIMSQVPDEHVHKFDGNFMDWEFRDGTTIWTGKGPRKYDNVRYVEMQNKYSDYAMNYDNETYIDKVFLLLVLMFHSSSSVLYIRTLLMNPFVNIGRNS
jgi:hypothetical protein